MRFVRALLCAVALACALGGSASAGSLPGQSPPLPATHTLNGLMSATDKVKIDGLVTPTLGTDLLRLEDVAVGNCAIQSSGVGGGASFSCITPITLDDPFTIVSNHLQLKTDGTLTRIGGLLSVVSAPPSGAAGGDTGGFFPNPTVLAAEFGAQRLTFATTPDLSLLKRSGTTVAPAVSGTDYVVTVRADGIATGTVQLASVNASNMIEGAVAYVSTVGDYFALIQSALTTDAITVIAASGKSGYQWVRQNIQNRNFWAVTDWYVDPASGSDENTGLSGGVGLKTYAEVSRRNSGRGASVSIHEVSDATDTDVLSLNFAPGVGTSVSVFGSETVLASGTVASHVAPSYIGGNTLNQITITSFNWSTYVGRIIRKSGASGGTGVYASVLADLGSGTALIAPTVLNSTPSATSYFQTGDVVQVIGLTKTPQIQTTNVSTLLLSLSSLYRTTGSWSTAMHGVATSAILSFDTIGVGGTSSSQVNARSLTGSLLSIKNSFSAAQGSTSLTNAAFIGTTAFYNLGTSGGNSITLSDVTLYPTSASASSPLLSIGPNSSVTLQSRTSPAIGVGIFNLPAGAVGIAIGSNSILTAGSIYGASNNAASWVLAYPRGTKFVASGQPLSTSFYETSSAGVKIDWTGNAITNASSSMPNALAGVGSYFVDRYSNGRGSAIASASLLLPTGILSFREWNVTGTATVNTMTIFPEANGVSILNDGTIVELDIQDGLTITHNASRTLFIDAPILLAGGVNAALPAGSHITFRFNKVYGTGTGTWVEVGRDSGPALGVWGNPTSSPTLQQQITSGGGSRYLGSNSANTAVGFVQIIESDILNLVADLAAKVSTSRTLSVTAPGTIDGGGSADLSANRTIAFPVFGASGPSHHAGLVPDPGASAGTTRFIREDGTLAVPPGTAGSGITAGTGPVTFAGSGSVATAINLGAGGIGGALPLPDVAAPTGTGFPHVTGSTWDSSVAALDATLVFSTVLGRAAISGDGTISAGSNVFNLNTVPNDTALPGDFLATNSGAPGSPVTGKTRCWVDSTTFMFTCKNSTSALANLVQPNTGTTNFFVTGISSSGNVSLGRPTEADVLNLVTDMAAKQGSITAIGMLKGLGGGSVIAASPGIDYQAPGNYITALTGDGTANGPGSVLFTLANTGVTANTYGGPNKYIQSIQVDAKGRMLANPVVVSGAQAVVWKWFARGEFLNYDPTNKSDAFAMADGDSIRWAGTGASVLAMTVLNSETTNSAPYYTNNITPDSNGTFQVYLGYASGVGGGSASLKVDLFAIHGSPGNSSNYTDLASCAISPTQAVGDNIGSCSSSISTGFSAGDLFVVVVSRADTNPSLSLNNISITATASISQ